MSRTEVFRLAAMAGICLVHCAALAAPLRDGGIDPANLGKGVWIYAVADATNQLGGHVAGVTNASSLMQYFQSVGLRYCIVKTGTSDKLFRGCDAGPQFTSNLVNAAHAHGIWIFGYNRSYGSNIVGEISIADYAFHQGADGFIFDAETEWESGQAWITNGPAQAWLLCSTVRSNWPNKFLAHAPFPIINFHPTFPYKEFGYWCDAVMPQIYHFNSTNLAGLRSSPSATINWADVNWATWQESLYDLPVTNINGISVNWTNAIKPIAPVQDVYGEVVSGGIGCASAAGAVYADEDVQEFLEYTDADPHAPTIGGYRGASFWRADTIGTNQWAFITASTIGNVSNHVNNIVLDDSSAVFVGGWKSVCVFAAAATTPFYLGATGTDTNCFGTNYFWKERGDGSAFAQYNPTIVAPGNYDVFQWHPFLTNASSGTPIVIGTALETNLVFANLQTNSGKWSWVGRYYFPAGTNNFVRVQDNFDDPTRIAVVDGLKFAYAGPLSSSPVTANNFPSILEPSRNTDTFISGAFTNLFDASGALSDDAISAGASNSSNAVPARQ